MTANLRAAFDKLLAAGVREKDLPTEKEAKEAKSGTKWKGKKKNGYSWTLTKRYANDFKAEC